MCRSLLFVCFAIFAQVTSAHDIGVTEVTLQELPSFNYQLIVENPNNEGFLAKTELPEHCKHSAKHINEGNTRIFRFSCQSTGLSNADELIIYWQTEAILLTAQWHNGSSKKSLFLREGEVIRVPIALLSSQSQGVIAVGQRYLILGFEHILEGIDHLLFVLGLLLLISGKIPLLKAITAFTLGHSLTLVMSFLDLIQLPASPVEACIAFSIVILAWEIILSKRGKGGLSFRYPWLVAAAFGLIHGLGFAGALKDLGVAQAELLPALLFFNLGVELGQVFFISCVIAVTGFFSWLIHMRHREYCQLTEVIKIPAAYILGITAMYWTIERASGILLS